MQIAFFCHNHLANSSCSYCIAGMMSTKNATNKRILDEVRDVMRLHHYSIHTERSYCDWIRRFILFHKMKNRDQLNNGSPLIEKFLTHLAIDKNISPSTQNQAMNALVFFYKKVLKQKLDGEIDAIRSKRKITVTTVLSVEEVIRLLLIIGGVSNIVVRFLYNNGLRVAGLNFLQTKREQCLQLLSFSACHPI